MLTARVQYVHDVDGRRCGGVLGRECQLVTIRALQGWCVCAVLSLLHQPGLSTWRPH